MVADIIALYNGDMTKLHKSDSFIDYIHHDAIEIAKFKGGAIVIKVGQKAPTKEFSTIDILKYSSNDPGSPTKVNSLTIPKSLLEMIAKKYSKE